jgi:hypothetical protein
MVKLNSQQLGRLLFKAAHEPRRNQKRYLKDLGLEGSAEELDRVLALASRDATAVREAEQMAKRRKLMARAVEVGVDSQVIEMLAEIRLKMEDHHLTQQDLAERCGWQQPLVAAYLTGAKEPGVGNLAKMAMAVGCVWRLAADAER